MSWKYYRDGELIKECNDLPETMEDAVIELQENGYDVSDCILEPSDGYELMDNGEYIESCDEACSDFWSPDYPPENSEPMFKPLTDKEEKTIIKILNNVPILPAPKGFRSRLYNKIKKETGVNMKPKRLNSTKSWWHNVTHSDKVYFVFWIIFFYILAGMIIQDRQILRSFLEIILWPFFV